ncbi:MAG: PEGA domain-containing protein, partial [Myxococcota bacterium]
SASPPRTGSGSFPAVSPARAFARASSSITPAAADGLAEDTGKTGEHRIGGGDASKADTSVEPLPPPPGGLLAFQGSAGATDGTGATAAAALDDVDERAIEFAWGGRERPKSNPALLDEVPDVSAVSVEALARTGDIDAGAEADVAVVTTRFKPDALLADSQHSELYDCIEVVAPSDDDDSEDDSDSSMTAVAKLSGQSAAAASTSADGGVGAGLIAERGRRRGRFATIGGLVAFAALAAVLVLFMMRGDGVQAPAAALSAAPSAAIKFIVEPADATIAVLGYGEHSGAPHKLQVAAPGTYRVEISRDGYRSYVTELEVGSGENHVVRVYLEQGGKDSSQVTIRLRSDDWRVMLDGKRLPGTSPLIVEVATGTHTLSVLDDDGDEVWRNEFDAVANTNYEFEPQVERKRRRKKDRDNSEKQPDVEIHDQVAIAEPVVPDAQADKPDAGVFAALDTTTRSALPDLPKTEPPPAPKQRPQKATILANKVKKVAGPKLDLDLRGESYSGRASAKLCIDVTGKVSSVTVLSKLPSRVKDSLARNLRQWRYTPYVSEGQPTPACFAVHFRIEN